MQALSTATKLDWRGWFRGLVGAFVSGGAGAIATGMAVEIRLDTEFRETVIIMGITALVSAVVSLGKYLQTTPVPEYKEP